MLEFDPSYPIVSVQWLQANLGNPGVAIADCRFSLADSQHGRQQYEAGHIPGAYYFDLNQDLSSPRQQHGGRHPLPDIEHVAMRLGQAGIQSTDPKTLVVAYDDSRFGFAARFWWLLRYLGHERVALLNGGFATWKAAGYPVETDTPTVQATHFVPHVQSQMVVDIEMVRSRKDQPGVFLVDSREGDRYRGEREPLDPIAGHIPGAVNYPWQEVTEADGTLRPVNEQQRRWEEINAPNTTTQETHPPEEIMVYCGSGVTACVNLLSLEVAGVRNTKLYVGSWSDWCSYLPQS